MHKPVIPAVATWKRTLHPEPAFNSKRWGILYSPLVSNKQGDINWLIAHHVLPTALSLHRMTVYDSPFCNRCGLLDTLDHALVECVTVKNFLSYVQTFMDKLTQNNLPLTAAVKLLGKIHKPSDPFNERSMDLVKWTLTVARYAIFRSAVYHRKDTKLCLQKLFLLHQLSRICVLNLHYIYFVVPRIIFKIFGVFVKPLQRC